MSVGIFGCRTAPLTGSRWHGERRENISTHTVVVDAGHGGHDPGASRHSLKEKVLALDIATRLRHELEDSGVQVVMTRQIDHFIPLSNRPAIANRLRADLFVSVHLNANERLWVSGAEVYYPRESVVGPSAPWPPSVKPTEVARDNLSVKPILWDLVLGYERQQAQRLSSSICTALHQDLQVECVTKPARFVVLREALMPAVLVEVGYMSNPQEAGRLSQEGYRETAAYAIAQGILDYLNEEASQNRARDSRP